MKIFGKTHVYRETAGDEDKAPTGTPAPEPEVVETPPEASSETPPDEGNDRIPEEVNLWEQLSKDDDDDSSEDESSALPETPPEVPPAKEEPPTPAETPAEETPPETPTETPVETPPEPQPTETETPVPPETPSPTDEELAKQTEAAKASMKDAFKKHYNLSDEDKLRMVTEPDFVLDLQSRMMTDFWFGMQKWIELQMPQMVQQNIQVVESQNEQVDDFFKAWPKLDRKTHGKTVSQVAKTYAQVNPNATPEEVTRFVGMQTMLLHGIAPDLEAVSPTGQPAVPPPAAPPQTPSAPGYQPPAVNAAKAQQSGEGNLWEGMAEELLEDDSNY